MRIAIYCLLVESVLAGVILGWVGRRLAPRAAAWALTLGAVAAAASWMFGLGLLAVTLADEAPLRLDHALGFRMSGNPVPPIVSIAATAVLGLGAIRATASTWHRVHSGRALALATGPARSWGPADLLVVADTVPQAFAVPHRLGLGGRVVVSSGLLQQLDAGERSALLQHERSHLRHHHSWFRHAVHIAAAVLPTLGALRAQLDSALERWADEDAAGAVGSRRLVARTVCRAALASVRADDEMLAKRVAGPSLVTARVRALQAEPRTASWLPALVVAVLMIGLGCIATEAARDLESLFDPSATTAAGPSYYPM